MKFRYSIFIIFILIFISCKPEINDGFQPSNGSADFSKYVALGNSLTAGYADGALYHSAQSQSWTSILANQMKEVGGGDFIQPVVESEQGILAGKLKLGLVNGQLMPVPAEDGELEAFYPPINYAVNNLGVPGAKVSHLLAPGYGNIQNLAAGQANPYFIRFASSPNISVIEQAIEMQPSFFSLWIGNNDVLGYASNGGAFDEITPLDEFQQYYSLLAQSLAATGAKGVLANIPDVTSAAYFNTIPIDALEIDAGLATQMNFGIGLIESNLNSILTQIGMEAYSYNIEFTAGKNRFLIEDNSFPYKDLLNAIADTTTNPETKMLMHLIQFRQIQDGELLTLQTPQDSLAMGMGSFMTIPGSALPVPYGIPNRFVLDIDELNLIGQTIENYNNVIEQTAQNYSWALVNVNDKFNEMKNGVVVDGIDLNAEFVTGGIFSLDGIHLTPRGNAVVANFFIDEINKKYGAAVSRVSINQYNGVKFP